MPHRILSSTKVEPARQNATFDPIGSLRVTGFSLINDQPLALGTIKETLTEVLSNRVCSACPFAELAPERCEVAPSLASQTLTRGEGLVTLL